MESECLDADTMYGYIMKNLSDIKKKGIFYHLNMRDEICAHIRECDFCLDDYLGSLMVLSDIELPSPVSISESESEDNVSLKKAWGKIKQAHKWIKNLRPPEWIMEYSPSPVRSPAALDTAATLPGSALFIQKSMKQYVAEIYVEKREKSIRIFIRALKNNETPKQITLSLKYDQKPPAKRVLGKNNFDNRPFGEYELILKEGRSEIGNCLLNIDDKGIHEFENTIS